MTARHLLIVHHSPPGGTTALTGAVIDGARHPDVRGLDVRAREALTADADDVRWADGLILGTTENFGYMSGALKHFFDRVFYDVIDETRGRPFGLYVKAGQDGQGAVEAVRRITTGLSWRLVLPPLVVVGPVQPDHLNAGGELGMTMAAGLEAAIF